MFEEFLATGSFEDRSPPLNNIGYTPRMHRDNVIFDHSGITPHDTKYLHSIIYTGTNNSTDGCIHSRGVAAGSEYANFSDFVFHLQSVLNVGFQKVLTNTMNC